MKTYLSRYKRAAIIGHWRNGSTLEQIAVATGVEYERVKITIENYFKIELP